MPRSPRSPGSGQDGAAVVDFVLVAVVLVPLVLGLVQVGLTLYVRNALAAAATEGARHAAAFGRAPQDGVTRARGQLTGVIGDRFVREVSARAGEHASLPVVEVRVRAVVPALGLGGPGLVIQVTGHGVRETAP